MCVIKRIHRILIFNVENHINAIKKKDQKLLNNEHAHNYIYEIINNGLIFFLYSSPFSLYHWSILLKLRITNYKYNCSNYLSIINNWHSSALLIWTFAQVLSKNKNNKIDTRRRRIYYRETLKSCQRLWRYSTGIFLILSSRLCI